MYFLGLEQILWRGQVNKQVTSRKLKQQSSLNVIPAIQKGNNLVSSSKDINEVLKQFHRELYTLQVSPITDKCASPPII